MNPHTPASTWRLSPRGVVEARALGEIARGWGLAAIYSSVEPKASATAALIGDAVGLPVTRLVRLRIGGVRLGGLAPGEHRELTREEVMALRGPAAG